MLTGAQWNEVCECPDANSRESYRKIVNINDENHCFLVGPIAFECKDEKCPYRDGFYQRFSNVCRRESIYNESLRKADSIELNSIDAESNSICTSVGTQTPSVKDATIQTTHSIESLTEESPSDLNLKFSSFSNRRIRNYINYSKLVNSEFTKTSSIDSSFKDESTQFDESLESEKKSYSGNKHTCSGKSFCQCHDFYPKEEIYKVDISETIGDEIYYGNGNINLKDHKYPCKNTHLHYPDSRNNFSRSLSLGHHSHPNQYLPFNPVYFDKHSSIICPCYNLLRFNPVIEKCDFKQQNEQCTKKTQINGINNNLNTSIFENSQSSTFKENFHAQQQQHNTTDGSKVNLENKLINNCAFDNAEYKVEILDEKANKSLIKNERIDNDKELEKDSDFLEENEQSKPLLGDKVYSLDMKDEIINSSNESEGACDETQKDDADATTEICVNGCHCHHHECTVSSVRAQPNKKKSSRTHPLKIITLILFGSAFLITGSALKDAYYP